MRLIFCLIYLKKNKILTMKKLLFIIAGSTFIGCLSASIFAQTPGVLTFTFTPTSHNGYSGTKNVLAVWIQTSSGGFVKTKIRRVGNGTKDHLPTWSVNAGGSAGNAMSSSCNMTDASTGATLSSFTTKTITWDGKNVNGTSNGTVVTDAVYKVTIQETWDHGGSGTVLKSYTFTKGPNADHQTPANDANFTNITLDWVPSTNTGVESISENPGIAVYPNPTNGIFNVDYTKASNIKVINTLGAIVFEEKVEAFTSGSKSIDLTNLANGIYFIIVSNSNGTSNHKLILNK